MLTLIKSFNQRLRFTLGGTAFILGFAAINATLYQLPLYRFAFSELDATSLPGVLAVLTLFAMVMLLTLMALFLFALVSQRLLKPLAMFIAFGNSIALYFIQTYQVVLDKHMMGNVFNTNTAEAASYLHPAFFLHLVLFGVLPIWLISRITLKHTSRLRIIAALSLSLLLGIGWIYANAQSWFWIDKHARKLGGMIMPWSYVINSARYQTEKMMQSRILEKLPPAHFVAQGKTVVVLVIGESARAANFSLYGYARNTNPLLSEAGAIAIPNSHSCSTYTTASIQCMLAHVDSSSTLIHNYEALPSYLQSNGVDVIWISNNWGEPPLKVGTYLKASEVRGDCKGLGCQLDEGMLTGLAERIAKTPNDKVFVVLHQSGSHGPDYFNHYPQDAEKFSPACRSVQVQDCSADELNNAYDNTILFTDRFLSKTIALLRSLPNTSTLMMYASDHGESLGEHGLYLHGTPYSLAPDVQKDIPYIVWMSPAFKQDKTLTADAALSHAQHAHETIFHSVMGAFDMRSEIYKPQFDIFVGTTSSKKQK